MMLWKCRYCCSGSTWHCWGTTRFCGPCHDKQVYPGTRLVEIPSAYDPRFGDNHGSFVYGNAVRTVGGRSKSADCEIVNE